MTTREHVVTVAVAATPEATWRVLADVEAMPTWTASMTDVTILGDGPLQVGTKVRITQPRLPKTVWTVTELVEGREFTWVTSRPGARTVASHQITTDGAATSVTLRLELSGPLASVAWALSASLIRRYVQLEADGLAIRAAQL